jgi:hypothetical protein
LAQRPLFGPLATLLQALGSFAPCNLARLNALGGDVVAAGKREKAVRFVAPDQSPLPYEQRIVMRGEVVTRTDNWHDFFNALVWLRYPCTKRSLAQIHAAGLQAPSGDGRRGPVRDAATQFDESGVVAAASDPLLLDLLEQRRWQELFWRRRSQVRAAMRFLVFGHGLYDALRAPFYRICGRAASVVVAQSVLDDCVERQCAHVDAILAERCATRAFYPRPKALLALPSLGIPGVCAESERPEYYDDTLQFRPPP